MNNNNQFEALLSSLTSGRLRYFYVRKPEETFTNRSGSYCQMFTVWNFVQELIESTGDTPGGLQYRLDPENDDLVLQNGDESIMREFTKSVAGKVIAANVSDDGVAFILNNHTDCVVLGTLEDFKRIMSEQSGNIPVVIPDDCVATLRIDAAHDTLKPAEPSLPDADMIGELDDEAARLE